MEVILNQDVPNLGYKGDIVKVRPGYARNYLIPQRIGVTADAANRKISAENLKQGVKRIAQVKTSAQDLANQLQATTIEIIAKTGTSGKIFGSITTLQIAQALKEKGFDIDRRKIHLDEEIKNTGDYHATVDLHKEVKGKVNLKIIAETAENKQ
jgi:large subunit ribosomal protein L9